MKMTYNIALLAFLIFTGCGSEATKTDKINKTDKKTLSTAKLDALSTGITYECGSQSAPLANDGTFIFEKGEPCVFKDGDTIITTLSADQLKENKTYQETTPDLKTILDKNTYYAVKMNNPSITQLTFNTTDKGVLQATVTYNNQKITVPVTINNNTLSLNTLNDYEISFISDKGNYLLFEQNTRLFKDKKNAQQYIKTITTNSTPTTSSSTPASSGSTPTTSNSTPTTSSSTPTSSSSTPTSSHLTLENLLMGHTYYSVQPHDTRIVKLTFANTKNPDGTVNVTASLGALVMSTSVSITNSDFNVPAYGTFTFLSNQNDYLLFNANRRMYISKSDAQAFINANK